MHGKWYTYVVYCNVYAVTGGQGGPIATAPTSEYLQAHCTYNTYVYIYVPTKCCNMQFSIACTYVVMYIVTVLCVMKFEKVMQMLLMIPLMKIRTQVIVVLLFEYSVMQNKLFI